MEECGGCKIPKLSPKDRQRFQTLLMADSKEAKRIAERYAIRKKNAELFMKEMQDELKILTDDLEVHKNFLNETDRAIEKIGIAKNNIQTSTGNRFIHAFMQSQKTREETNKLLREGDLLNNEKVDSIFVHIASGYVEEDENSKIIMLDNLFPAKVYKDGSPNTSFKAMVYKAAEELLNTSIWTMNDAPSALAALEASKTTTPHMVRIIFRDEPPSYMPLTLLENALENFSKSVKLKLRCFDNFYNRKHFSGNDEGRFKVCLESENCKFVEFFGRLDEDSLSMMPDSVYCIGLPLLDAADMALVSGIKPWSRLEFIEVAVNIDISLDVLRPLPDTEKLCIHFYGLQNKDLEKIRPIIDVLLDNRPLFRLVFAACEFTAPDEQKISTILANLKIGGITFDPKTTMPYRRKSNLRRKLHARLKNESVKNLEVYFDMQNFIGR